MKKERIYKITSIVISSLMIIAFLVFIFALKRLNVTPFKYNLIIYIVLFVVSLIATIDSIFIKNKIINIVVMVIRIFIIILTIIVIKKVNVANSFFDKIKESEETSIYYVMVLKKNDYNDFEDLNNKKIGYLDNTSTSLKKVLKELKNNKKKKYDNIALMLLDLDNGKIDAILVNSANDEIIREYDKDYAKKVKRVKKVIVKEKVKPAKKVDDNETINVLISGIDVDGDINNVSRSDVNIIMTINPKEHEVLLTSIPRDTYVYLHGVTSIKDKLTHAGTYGISMTEETIEDFLGIEIDYYVRINFSTLTRVVDAVGGVDVYSDVAFGEYGHYYNQGYNHLNGDEALYYARIRHVFVEGDRKRGEHQKQIIEAIINKVSSSKELLTNYEEILSSLAESFQTNIPTSLVKKYARNQLDKMPSWEIKSIAVNGYDSHGETYSMPGWDLYLVIPYQETIDYCQKMINEMKKGKKMNDINV